jgi:hypothetical protein
MNYQIKEYEMELNSKDYPALSFAQFEQLIDKSTLEFVGKMTSLNAQFIAQQDFTPLQVQTKFLFVAGCAAIRRLYQFDVKNKNHFIRLEASALVEVAEEATLPGEKQLNQESVEAMVTKIAGATH